MNGFVVIGDYEQLRDGQVTFQGHGIQSYDTNQKCYLLHWWDTMGMGEEIFRGGFEGEKYVLTSKNPMGYARLTYEFPEPGRMLSKMDMSQDGKNWQSFMECDYRRKD